MSARPDQEQQKDSGCRRSRPHRDADRFSHAKLQP